MFGHLFGWLIEQDREKDVERHEQLAKLIFTLAAHVDDAASPEFREWALPIVKDWVVENLDPRATAAFDDSAIAVRHLDGESFGVAGAVEVSVSGRNPVRSWFVADIAEDGTIAFADIVDFDPQVSPRG